MNVMGNEIDGPVFDMKFQFDGDQLDEAEEAKSGRTFKESTNDLVIDKFSRKMFAPESRRKMKWAVNMYSDWRICRLKGNAPVEIVRADLNALNRFSQDDLSFALARFIREIKCLDGTDYPPNTLREVIVMIQMYLNENNIYWKLLEGERFLTLRNVVDNTMKQRTAMGLGLRRSSEIISLSQEDLLFSSGALGDDEPLKLLHTVIYMMGLHLALRGGVEHNRLRRPGFESQICVDVDTSGREVLVYTEDPLHKTNQGGLMSKQKSKIVYVYGASNPENCPIRIFKKYVKLLPPPKSCRKLYLRVKPKPTPSVWYADQPFGVNKVSSAVKDICKKGGWRVNIPTTH